MFWQRCFCIFFFLLIPNAYPEKQDTKKTEVSEKALVLQWEVSHTRNTDQISLIFRQNIVELVSNTSSYQKKGSVRLGLFQSPMNPELKELKDQIKQYYIRLQQTIPLSHLIKDSRVQPIVDSHVPVLRINEEEMHEAHPYFKPLASIIYKVWERKWICVECATYKKRKKSIVRIVRKLKTELKEKTKKKWVQRRQSFSRKILNCISKGKNKVECIDPRFGIFEI